MYAWLWRRLPGGGAAKMVAAVILVLLIVAVLFTWVFPWVNGLLPIDTSAAERPQPAATTQK